MRCSLHDPLHLTQLMCCCTCPSGNKIHMAYNHVCGFHTSNQYPSPSWCRSSLPIACSSNGVDDFPGLSRVDVAKWVFYLFGVPEQSPVTCPCCWWELKHSHRPVRNKQHFLLIASSIPQRPLVRCKLPLSLRCRMQNAQPLCFCCLLRGAALVERGRCCTIYLHPSPNCCICLCMCLRLPAHRLQPSYPFVLPTPTLLVPICMPCTMQCV